MLLLSSRREFLIQLALVVVSPNGIRAFGTGYSGASTFAQSERELLKSAMDEMIPDDNGMPSASAAGGLEYLQQLGWQYPDIAQELKDFLAALRATSHSNFGKQFNMLPAESRIEVLAQIEKRSASKLFNTFVGHVYEAYYTEARVTGTFACSPPPLSSETDQALFADVRKMTHRYRDVR